MTLLDPRLERAQTPVVKVFDIACIFWSRPNLEKAETFLSDFGLQKHSADDTNLRMQGLGGYGPCYVVRKGPANFLGLSLVVNSIQDLHKLAKLPGAGAIEQSIDHPGGQLVRLYDPAGVEVQALLVKRQSPTLPRQALLQNQIDNSQRINQGQRPAPGPANIARLGHLVLSRVNFFENARWYLDTFGLIASDVQVLPDGSAALAFLRCDRGDIPTDHHTIVVGQHVLDEVSHSAYECIDLDDVAMAQEHLHSRGWQHAWGLGRHILGSQIFDYWRDPWGDKVEHFCDGDVFTSAKKTDVSAMSLAGIYQWGPALPTDFERPKFSFSVLVQIIKNLAQNNELSFSRLKQLLKLTRVKTRSWT